MKRLVALLLCSLSTLCFATPDLRSKYAYVFNINTGETIFAENHLEEVSIASITKLMTGIVIRDAGLDLNERIKITKEDVVATSLNHKRTRSGGVEVNQVYTREELLKVALMSSNNRAAAALARTYPGGVDAFISAMNDKARSIGMVNTTFVDPTGLYNDNKSTASDLAKLLAAATSYPLLMEYSTSTEYERKVSITKKKRVRQIKQYFGTTNRLLLTDDWDIQLQKTGFIRAAGFCVVMIVNVHDQQYGVILLNAPNKVVRAIDAIKVKYWIEYHNVPPKQVVAELNPYRGGSKKRR